MSLRGQGFKGAIDERAEVPAVHEFVGGFAGGVVAAGEHARFVVDAVTAKVVEHVARIPGEERQVVGGVDDQCFARRGGGESIHE